VARPENVDVCFKEGSNVVEGDQDIPLRTLSGPNDRTLISYMVGLPTQRQQATKITR
jgi:hypothetical protein